MSITTQATRESSLLKNQLRKAIDAALERLRARDRIARESSVEYQIETDTGAALLDVCTRSTLPLIPSVGFTWTF